MYTQMPLQAINIQNYDVYATAQHCMQQRFIAALAAALEHDFYSSFMLIFYARATLFYLTTLFFWAFQFSAIFHCYK